MYDVVDIHYIYDVDHIHVRQKMSNQKKNQIEQTAAATLELVNRIDKHQRVHGIIEIQNLESPNYRRFEVLVHSLTGYMIRDLKNCEQIEVLTIKPEHISKRMMGLKLLVEISSEELEIAEAVAERRFLD